MSATAPTGPTPVLTEDELLDRQKALTQELYDHPDPHVRLLAHMSERQLGMMELVLDTRKTVQTVATTVEELATTVNDLTGRQELLERKLNNGGTGGSGGHQLSLPISDS
jgi:hypothetical protein